MKKVLSLLIALIMVLVAGVSVFAETQTPVLTTAIYGLEAPETDLADPKQTIVAAENDIVILVTNDVHCGNYENYAKVATLAKSADILADTGDHLSGSQLGSISKGEYIVRIMNKVGYDVATLGNHEYDFGIPRLEELSEMAEYKYVSCNFVDVDTNEPIYDSYTIYEVKGKKIAIVGITSPETFAKSTPTHFQDADGNYIYGFCQGGNGQELYKSVQETVNAAKAAGADYVIGLAHLGINEESQPWTVDDLLANVTGFTAVADGHSHSQYALVKNGVPTIQSGSNLTHIAQITIKEDGTVSTNEIALDDTIADDEDVAAFIKTIDEEYKATVSNVVAKTEVALTIKNADGTRAVRSKETNLGDLCADAYRVLLGADVAFVNGGGVRADLEIGELTLADIMSVHPFGNKACLVEVTGQQILDALELGSSKVPGENGGFLQVSGLTYTINTAIPSSVVINDESEFVEVAGARRVCDVKIGGVDIDPEKTYKLASHNYMLKSAGDGYTMFGKNNVTILQDEVMIDNQVLIAYITETLGGVVGEEYSEPQGRITIVNIPDEWYFDGIYSCYKKGIMNGIGNGDFAPDDDMSRAAAVTMLWKLNGCPYADYAMNFDDVSEDAWYAEAVRWAASEGIANGDGTSFNPDKSVTRQELAVMLYRYEQKYGDGGFTGAWVFPITGYSDVKDIADWADEAMHWMTMRGVIQGCDGKLNPAATATRAEVAVMFERYMNLK